MDELSTIPRQTRLVVLLGSMCAFLTSLNQSIMSVAFPDLRRSFPDVSAAQLSWVLNSYTIVAGFPWRFPPGARPVRMPV